MGFMLRSDVMAFCDIYLQKEAAFDIIAEFGEIGCIQFLDMTPDISAFHRRYIPELCRCCEMERRLMYIKSEMDKDKIPAPKFTGDEPNAMKISSFNNFESQLEKWEQGIQEMAAYYTKLLQNYQKLLELYYVLTHIGPLLGQVNFRRPSWITEKSGDATITSGLNLSVLSGVVRRSRSYSLELMLWRLCRGNAYVKLAGEDQLFEDPASNTMVRKVAFMVVCQGVRVQQRVEKICAGFGADLYPCPKTYDEREDTIKKLDTRLQDLDQVLKKSKHYRCKALRTLSHNWNRWLVGVRKSKAVYITMNLFSLDYARNCLIGECWVPEKDLAKVQKSIANCSEKLSPNVSSFMTRGYTELQPPTYHRTNKFTQGFQALISAYGDSSYRELNPGLYTLVTFPFLFSVMFGDFGHGLIVLAFALWMVLDEKKLIAARSDNEIWNIIFAGRYIILMMSLFTLYSGVMYNDIFSKSVVLFKSSWRNHYSKAVVDKLAEDSYLTLNPTETAGTYPIGVDPIWKLGKNRILNDNSLKMKMSIIFGVIHMLFGILLSLFNHRFFKQTHAIILEFLPQIIFLCCLFAWLVFLIILKWFLYSAQASTPLTRKPGCAPLVLIHFIDMCLMRKTKALDPNCQPYMFESQRVIQQVLLIIGLACIPVLLFGSPLFIIITNKMKNKNKTVREFQRRSRLSRISGEGFTGSSLGPINMFNMNPEPDTTPLFGELMIHQGVHTIEFILSTVSHTASYLRLWALSLAHSELTEMLWHMMLSKLALRDYSYVGAIKLFVVFAVWAAFTITILVIMEGLSAFLHTLRLHWVEFMSKFFIGDGTMFKPFTFRNVLYSEVHDDAEGACKKKVIVEERTL